MQFVAADDRRQARELAFLNLEFSMMKILTVVLLAWFALPSTLAFAQVTGGVTTGAASGVATAGSTGNSSFAGAFGVYSPGATAYGSPNIGAGNPGIGDESDRSIRASPGLDANGPCNGARSTSGNFTPSC